jgi:geranylgeranyl reductase family protein
VTHTSDVIIVGAGPGGSSAATFLARRGISTLVLDKAHFPRDKVCGDGLTPKALYWLDVLGCVDEVLDHNRSFLTEGDIVVNGEHVLTGAFPQDSPYPGFSILLERRTLDHILLRNAVANGAAFRPGCTVRAIHRSDDGVVVEASSNGSRLRFEGRVLIGADGANSVVSRAIGNRPREGTTAVSLRGYYDRVRVKGSGIQLYFDDEFFPGYGWLFADEDGKANVGIGYAVDGNFALRSKLKDVYRRFVELRLGDQLEGATPLGRPKGGWAAYYRPRHTTADRVLLVGDAANRGDPVNGGGIHMAMESAHYASRVVADALARDDCSAAALAEYELLWNRHNEMDWRTGDLLLSIAKNPHLREVHLSLIRTIATLARSSPRFLEFCGGVFNGVTPTRKTICPFTLMEVVPLDPEAWLKAVITTAEPGAGDVVSQAIGALRTGLRTTGRVVTNPVANLAWGAEIATKLVGLLACYTQREMAAGAATGERMTEAAAAPP